MPVGNDHYFITYGNSQQIDPARGGASFELAIRAVGLHIRATKHFLGLLDQGGEVGKKLDFLLQEMNREANTLLSKTSGLAGDALKITEMGLAIKTEIEKAREQVQNIE